MTTERLALAPLVWSAVEFNAGRLAPHTPKL
jgi:hypothetical protein